MNKTALALGFILLGAFVATTTVMVFLAGFHTYNEIFKPLSADDFRLDGDPFPPPPPPAPCGPGSGGGQGPGNPG